MFKKKWAESSREVLQNLEIGLSAAFLDPFLDSQAVGVLKKWHLTIEALGSIELSLTVQSPSVLCCFMMRKTEDDKPRTDDNNKTYQERSK